MYFLPFLFFWEQNFCPRAFAFLLLLLRLLESLFLTEFYVPGGRVEKTGHRKQDTAAVEKITKGRVARPRKMTK